MITIQKINNLVIVAVIGEFTLSDYKEFEQQVLYQPHFEANLLFDWRDMVDYTVDVAWEEIKFLREHGSEFGRVAVVTDNQWQAWSAWVSSLFVEADVRVFSDYDEAKKWAAGE
ncbi:STAS/SEC14 domain-containing protein [Nitrosomonas communis]|uniref:STAS/SEC14 domain-containing protein n=1 Tax=Nitrosomonas communis TaxID=44574 RepID=UPI0026F07C68|nr:STAS/SEC14 domain-containing protein [Nitrosomonas communis]MCO6427201.1 STAS/SEC14 domain-containing protein [Nitrosomonas communis]